MPTGLAVWIGITRLQVSWSAFASIFLFLIVAGEVLGRVLKGFIQCHAHWPGCLDWHHKIVEKPAEVLQKQQCEVLSLTIGSSCKGQVLAHNHTKLHQITPDCSK